MDSKNLFSNKGNMFEGVYLIQPRVFQDNRGFFYESWNKKSFNKIVGEEVNFLQDNHSLSSLGVLRGLHYQIEPKPQGKLVRCISGSVFDVAVDIRKNSTTFGEWTSVVLDELNRLMLWIPNGFAHGFLSLKEKSEVIYKASGNYSKEHERSIIWNDPSINIKWPLQIINNDEPNLSEKDANAPSLDNADIFI